MYYLVRNVLFGPIGKYIRLSYLHHLLLPPPGHQGREDQTDKRPLSGHGFDTDHRDIPVAGLRDPPLGQAHNRGKFCDPGVHMLDTGVEAEVWLTIKSE